jgi:hypothetical protein
MTQPPAAAQPPSSPAVVASPRGPNWRLVTHSIILLAGAGALLAHLARIRLSVSLTIAWPTVFIVAGVALVVVGQLGLLRRRRTSRRR